MQSLAVTVSNVNEAPAITSSATASIQENTTAVMTVTATDPDAATTLTYGIAGGADQALFQIDPNSGVLSFVSAPDREAPVDAGANNVYDVRVSVSDGTLVATRDIAVTVTDSNDTAPQITSDGGGATAAVSVAENTTAVTTVQATDPDLGPALTYSIAGGADAAAFVIDATSGALAFVAAPDFELPSDVGGNNVYDVVVRVSDGVAVDTQSIAVTVTDVLGFGQTVSTPSTTLAGGPEADTLNGVASDNLLLGNGGNDILTSGSGADTLDGGAGIDSVSYAASSSGVSISLAGGAGSGGDAAGDVLISVENLLGATLGANSLVGSTGDNVLTGGAGADTLDGGSGADTLVGLGGNDVYVVDAAGDVVTEGTSAGIDEVRTGLTAYTLAANVEMLTYTGGAAPALLVGNTLDNTITGGSGADTMVGGQGDDVYVVNTLTDVVTENLGEGTDTIRTGLATASLAGYANVENLTYTGGSNFSGTGNALNNVLIGGAGDDNLIGGAGSDTLDGGSAGLDLVDYSSSGSVGVTVNLATGATGGDAAGDTLVSIEYVIGASSGANSLVGDGALNFLSGGSGNDTLDGGANWDVMVGGAGDDVYVVDTTLDILSEQTNEGTDTIRTGLTVLSLANYANIENLTYSGGSDFSGTGNGLNNVLTGGAGNDTLIGGAGSDTLAGGVGADSLDGGGDLGDVLSYATSADGVTVNLLNGTFSGGDAAGDRIGGAFFGLIGSGSADQLTVGAFASAYGGDGNDTLAGGGSGNNSLWGGDGHDQLYGWGGNSVLIGGNGNDLLVSDQGDTLLGGDGADTMVSSADADSLDGGAGHDLLSYAASFGPVTVNLATGSASGGDAAGDIFANMEGVIGSGGNDSLTAADGGSDLYGGGGNDTLIGGIGNDTLEGGTGADSIVGGGGHDLVSYAASAGPVWVDFGGNTFNTGDAQGDSITGVEGVIGSAGNDTLSGGNVSAFQAYGGEGDDLLYGSNVAGSTLVGGAGDDFFVANADRAVTAFGGDGDDYFASLLESSTVNSRFDGGAGHDVLSISESVNALSVADLVSLATNVEEIDLSQPNVSAALTNFHASDAVSILGTSGPGNTLTIDVFGNSAVSFSVATGEFVSLVGSTYTFYDSAQLTHEVARVTVN